MCGQIGLANPLADKPTGVDAYLLHIAIPVRDGVSGVQGKWLVLKGHK